MSSLPSIISTNLSRKRKRTPKTVTFDVEHIAIIDTYSPLDYDRGSIFSPPVQYRINSNLIAETANKRNTPSLLLEIPSSPCDSETSSPDIEESSSNIDNSIKKKKPKLSVNTNLCSDGPLFFTKLSTNHVKHTYDDDNDIKNDYLIPLTPSLY